MDCRQQSSTSLYSSGTTPNFQSILPISFYRSTLLYTHNHACLTRESNIACLSRRVVGGDRMNYELQFRRTLHFAVTYRKPAALFTSDFTSRMKTTKSDARYTALYTALLVARGDDDEVRREDVAPSKDNSTAYSRGRKKPACNICGETTKTPIAATHRLTIPPTGREVGQRVGRVCLSASQLSTRPRETS